MSEEKKEVKLNIYQKLLEVRKSVDRLGKDGKNDFAHFKYVSSTMVLKSIREEMNNQGLILKPDIVEYIGSSTFYMTYTWINVDNPEETLVNRWFARADDKRMVDQAFGKAMTYSEKYFILKFFQIPTDEDDPDNTRNSKESVKKIIDNLENNIDIENLTFEKASDEYKKGNENIRAEIKQKIFKPFEELKAKYSLPKNYLKMTIKQFQEYCKKEDKNLKENKNV